MPSTSTWGVLTRTSAVEFDLQLTADDHMVVFHDVKVDHITNGTGVVNDLTLDQMRCDTSASSRAPEALSLMFCVLCPVPEPCRLNLPVTSIMTSTQPTTSRWPAWRTWCSCVFRLVRGNRLCRMVTDRIASRVRPRQEGLYMFLDLKEMRRPGLLLSQLRELFARYPLMYERAIVASFNPIGATASATAGGNLSLNLVWLPQTCTESARILP